MLATLYSVVLLAVVVFESRPAQSSSDHGWTCAQVTPARNFTIDQVFGDWFIAELSFPKFTELHFDDGMCINTTLVAHNSSHFSMTGITDLSIPNLEESWIWYAVGRDTAFQVIFQPSDCSLLVLASCKRNLGSALLYLVLSKRSLLSESQRADVYEALSAAGIPRTASNSYWNSTHDCSFSEE